jgi:hypothetical protein
MEASIWGHGMRVASTASGWRISIMASMRARKKSLGLVINGGQKLAGFKTPINDFWEFQDDLKSQKT